MKRLIILLPLVLLLFGCAGADVAAETQPQAPPETAPTETQPIAVPETEPIYEPTDEATVPPETVPMPLSIILEPQAPGIQEERCEDAVVDYSNAEDGYIMVRYLAQTDRRLKVLLKGPSTTYNYNLSQDQWTVFPLSDGNGSYQAGIYINVDGSKYATVMTAHFDVALKDEFAPFLRPNQYVNYIDAPDTMALGAELCAGLTDPLEKVAAVYDYVVENLTYDEEKAATVKSGYLPVLDEVLSAKKGICFDYATMMTAMLRSQEVPCKLVVGYAGSIYHSWISVWTEENGWVDGVIFFDGHVWKRMDPTFASSAEDMEQILDYIEHGNYTAKYLY